jgi:hypothetical protein
VESSRPSSLPADSAVTRSLRHPLTRDDGCDCALAPDDSLGNTADLMAGKGLAGAFGLPRIAQGTPADARTTIEELYAWEFDGPQYRDFCGVRRTDGKGDAGAIEAAP